ncbi:hypothetical protein [Gracilibacillus saliphilus]|nr:hypothetical protein [Gracilibacillus saliphilus]
MTKVIFSTSENHTKQLMLNFFKKTSIPRLKKQYLEQQSKQDTA